MLLAEIYQKFIERTEISPEKAEEILNYLYALNKEVIDQEIYHYERLIRETDDSQPD